MEPGTQAEVAEREGNTRESIIFLFHISAGLHAVPTARLHLCVNQLILGAAYSLECDSCWQLKTNMTY